MKTKLFYLLTIFVLLTACAHQQSKPNSNPANLSEADHLNAVINAYTDETKHLDAFSATTLNVEEDLSKFGDYPSPAYFARSKSIFQKALVQLNTIHPELLSVKDKRTYQLFKGDLEIGLEAFQYPDRYLDFNQMGNRLHSYIDDSSQSLTSFPFDSVKHYEDFVQRSEGFPVYVENQIALLKEGVKKRITLGCVVARATRNSYLEGLEPVIEKNPFFRPALFMPKTFSAEDRTRLTQELSQMVRDRIIPGFRKFDAYYQKEYLPHCRNSYGIGALPHGRAWYAYKIKASTNLPLTAEEVHQKGIQEVGRIQGELEKVKNQLGDRRPLKAFLKSLPTDPRYQFTSSEAMFNAFKKVKEAVALKIPTYFSLIPAHDYQLVETSNPEDPAGAYRDPTENYPFGRFVLNTINLKSTPIYSVTTLSLHEAVPGHHFQLALQFEMKNELSEYQRKLYFSNSFVEGWALYSEYLGNEMGMYTDPMQRLGNLNDEMLRAVRLVVDSGIHAKGWSRKQVLKYMDEHLASDAKDISNESNRYSVWPGQALAYKIGQLKIIELRKHAEAELGSKFDIRGFHRAVIGNGTVSLPVLEQQVNEWIAAVKIAGQR